MFSFNIFAEQVLKSSIFNDQFENKLELNEKTELIIFTKDKSSSEIVNKVFSELKFNNLEQKKVIYIADISQMPSFVTKLFALPKMRKYDYKIALDRDGLQSKDLPNKEDSISIIKLNKLNVVESFFINSDTELKKALESFLASSKLIN